MNQRISRLYLVDFSIMLTAYWVTYFLFQANIESLGQHDPFTLMKFLLVLGCSFVTRHLCHVYKTLWRYANVSAYLRLVAADVCAGGLFVFLGKLWSALNLGFASSLILYMTALIMTLCSRFVYQVLYVEQGRRKDGRQSSKIHIAIIGAGGVGASLAEELLSNPAASYIPQCFVDVNQEKAGREIHGIPVLLEDEATLEKLRWHQIQEVVFAIPSLSEERRRALYEHYAAAGYKIKVYDYPVMQTAGKKRYLREFDIEELLFRKPVTISDAKTDAYYRNKVILVTGGGGSIGSELCRQLAKMSPRQIIILDIYENGAYDVQQELKIAYGNTVDLEIEICSITDRNALERVFDRYQPQIVIHAAAHKHVPLMERNCIEAIHNNVFGTRNLVQLCEQFGTGRFMMVSTDKAVNPTNVMGATKRMCEMIVGSASTWGRTTYSSTRFGNVLGSAGSVIPLFRRQIANGGPITLTDRRIVRYFMTIPEAFQLVLQSGVMARNGELFVLDMGQPVKILDLAKNMIRLSGISGIEIVETGLRPGEKLYEELLVKTEQMDKTENSLIFIEKDVPLSGEELDRRLNLLQDACDAGDEEAARAALKQAVPTYRSPEEINAQAEQAKEMQTQRKTAESAVCV